MVVYLCSADAVNADIGRAVKCHYAALPYLAHFVLNCVPWVTVWVRTAHPLIVAHRRVLTWPFALLLYGAASKVRQPCTPDKLWIVVTPFGRYTTRNYRTCC